jgi:hypothetical protein
MRNGVLYKRFWTLIWNENLNRYGWSINRPQSYDDVLAFAEVGVSGR